MLRRLLSTAAMMALAALLVGVPFLSGYVVGHVDGVGPPRTPLEPLLDRVNLLEPREDSPPSPSSELSGTFKPFWETWAYVNREFYDEAALDAERLSRGAIKGVLGSLEDPYTLYLDPLHREITEADLRGAFDGIGVQVEMVDEQLQVVAPLDGSPGERAGLRPGDRILRVDGREVKGMGLGEAIRLIRGPRGSTVTLTILRESRPSFTVPVQREEIKIAAVRGEMRPDGIAYVRITNFSQRVGADLRQTLDQLRERSPRGWVLDLRSNPGGYLDGAVAVTSQFVEDGVVLFEQRRGGDRREIRTRGHARASVGPMAVLVDKGTASAAEIVAGALRDHGRATVIGEQTFGKGSVQIVHSLSDGSAVRLTVARWLTPSGEPIQGVGLAPQILVAATAGTDAPLEQAVDHLWRQQPANAGREAPVSSLPSSFENPLAPAHGGEGEGVAPHAVVTEGGDVPALTTHDSVGILDSTERMYEDASGLV